MKKVIIILFILISSIVMGSEDNSNKSEFGFVVGPSIGYGLSYKTVLDDKLAIRFSGGFFQEQNSYYDEENNEITYNIGIELNYSIKKNDNMNFYTLLSLVHTYENREDYYGDDDYDDYYYNNYDYIKEHDTRISFGFGFSRYFNDTFVLSIEFHQVFEHSLNLNNDKTEFNIYPAVGSAIGFLF